MLQLELNGEYYSKIFERVEWSGGVAGTFRTLLIEVEKNKLPIILGEKIKFYVDNKLIFFGMAVNITKSEKEIDQIIFYDNGVYLNKNKFIKNIFNKKPSDVVKEICGELSLTVGKLPQDKVVCEFPAIDKSGYQIILSAYTIQHNKDGKIYSLNVNTSGEIEIIEQGTLLNYYLNSKNDLRSAEYTESIEDIINQIVVYKTEGDKVQIFEKVANEEDKESFGIFQDVMRFEGDKNNIFNAKDMLKTVEQTATVVANGNIELVSGYSVGIEENRSGLYGTFLIEKDKHIWTSTDYEVELTLNFENVMDIVEFQEEQLSSDKKYTLKDEVKNE